MENFNQRFNKVLEQVIEQSVDEQLLNAAIQDAGLHSISFVKFIVALENEFDREFGDNLLDSENFNTLREFRESLKAHVAGDAQEPLQIQAN